MDHGCLLSPQGLDWVHAVSRDVPMINLTFPFVAGTVLQQHFHGGKSKILAKITVFALHESGSWIVLGLKGTKKTITYATATVCTNF